MPPVAHATKCPCWFMMQVGDPHFAVHTSCNFTANSTAGWQERECWQVAKPVCMHCRSQQVSTQPLVCQPLYERGRVLNGCSRPKALGTAGVDHSFGNHCELSLAVTRYGMLQSNFMQCTEHATAMSIPFVCALVCTSLLYDIKSSQSSDVVLPLEPEHLSCLSC